MRKLNKRRDDFCLLYVGECVGNAAESVIKAGYKCKNARSAAAIGANLLATTSIQTRIKELNDQLTDDAIMKADEMQRKLTKLIREEIKEETVVITGIGAGVSKASIVEKKASFKEIIKAIETLGRMQGAFNNDQSNLAIPIIISGSDKLED